MHMIITISGQPGSGKSTVARLLAKRLGWRHYSMGDLRRRMALERGMTIAQLNALGERSDLTDKDVDEYQKTIGQSDDNLVIDGRLSFHFIPRSFKVFLTVRPDVGARRILADPRETERFSSLDDAVKGLAEREKSDAKRYRTYYGIDHTKPEHYDLIVDTSDIAAKEVARTIILKMRKRR